MTLGAPIESIAVPSIFTLFVILVAGLAIGYIMGERSGRKEEAERAAAVLRIVAPRAGWAGEQRLREMDDGSVDPALHEVDREGPYDDPRNGIPTKS